MVKQIDEFVQSIYKSVDGNREEIEELKQEMRSHLIEAVHDLKQNGKSEKEAIDIAIGNFGGKKQIVKGLSEFFSVQKRFARYVLIVALIFLVIGMFFATTTTLEIKNFREEKGIIMNDVLSVLGNSEEMSTKQEAQIIDIYNDHTSHLSKLAVFNVDNNKSLQDWLKENKFVQTEPETILPIEYKYATAIVNDHGMIANNNEIDATDYDLGTVVMANDHWIVQYEYSSDYREVIEKNNKLEMGLLAYFLNVFQLPILFISLFGVLIIVWVFLKKYNNKLKGLID